MKVARAPSTMIQRPKDIFKSSGGKEMSEMIQQPISWYGAVIFECANLL